MELNVRWNIFVRVVTAFYLLLLAGSAVGALVLNLVWVGLVALVLFAGLVFCAAMSPRCIRLTNEALEVHKFIGVLRIPFSTIDSVSGYRSLGMELRLCGSGGMMGFTGRYYNKREGSYTAFVGSYDHAFMVITRSGKKYLLSCENHAMAIADIRQHIINSCSK